MVLHVRVTHTRVRAVVLTLLPDNELAFGPARVDNLRLSRTLTEHHAWHHPYSCAAFSFLVLCARVYGVKPQPQPQQTAKPNTYTTYNHWLYLSISTGQNDKIFLDIIFTCSLIMAYAAWLL